MPPARTIGDYELGELLHSFPDSDIYKAWDTKQQRWVTVRLIRPGDAQTVQQVLRQAEAASGLHHQNIAAIYKVGKDGDTPFVVSEYVEGEPVLDWLGRQGRKPPKVLALALQIADALRYAHRQRVLHRALSPSVILVTKNGQVKIPNFGSAPVRAADLKTDRVTQTLGATDPNVEMTTLPYSSPERARAGCLDERSDLFSMGAVLYQMTTGAVPFAGETPQQVLHKIYNSNPEPITKFTEDFPPGWEQILNRLLEKDPAQRYQTADQFIQDASALAGRLSRIERTRQSATRLALLVTIIAAIGLVYWNDWYRLRPISLRPEITPLIHSGASESQPHAALGGKLIAYISDQGGNPDVWFLDRQSNRRRQLLSTPEEEAWPSLSPDGAQIVFARYPIGHRDASLAQIFTISREGVSEKKIADSANDPVWSADGTKIVFSKFQPSAESRIASAAVTDPTSRRYLTGGDDGPLPHRMPAISPDGKSIVYTAGVRPSSVWLKELGGDARPLVADNFNNQFPVWDPHRNRILYSSNKDGSSNIWSIGLEPNATARQLTSLRTEVGRIALAGAGTFFFEQTETVYEIHLLDLTTGKDKVAVSSRNKLADASWNGTMQITYVNVRGKPEIWETDRSGENSRAIMADNYSNSDGAWSPDGSTLAFISDRSGSSELWIWKKTVMKTEQLTNDAASKQDIAWSADGHSLAYIRRQGTQGQIYIFDTASHKSHRLFTPHDAARPNWPPDSRWIYYQGRIEASPPKIFRIPSAGGEPQRVCDSGIDPSVSASGDLAFLTADGRALLRLLPKNPKRSNTLVTAPSHCTLLEAKYAPDGKMVLYLSVKRNSDISSLSFRPM